MTFFLEECVCDQILPDAWEQTQPWQCPGPGVSPHRHLDIVVMVKKITLTSNSNLGVKIWTWGSAPAAEVFRVPRSHIRTRDWEAPLSRTPACSVALDVLSSDSTAPGSQTLACSAAPFELSRDSEAPTSRTRLGESWKSLPSLSLTTCFLPLLQVTLLLSLSSLI